MISKRATRAELADLAERYRLALHSIRDLADEYGALRAHRRTSGQPPTDAEISYWSGIETAAKRAGKQLYDLDPAFRAKIDADVKAERRRLRRAA